MYKRIIRPILFRFSPEFAHNLTLSSLKVAGKSRILRALIRLFFKRRTPELEKEVFGINFPNPIGLAGGMDKNAEVYNSLSDFGFGFVEVGSLTPEPQPGNPKPRLFRLPKDGAIINRMGINNKGVHAAINNLKKNRPDVIVVANIAKNSRSEGEQIAKDYNYAFSMLYDFVDMFVFNISCPNVEGLANLQDVSYLSEIMDVVLDRRVNMEIRKPVLLKVSPDLANVQLDEILEYAQRSGIDGIVAGNTSKQREGLSTPASKVASIGNGGLSGAPLFEKNLNLVKYIHEKTNGRLPIIGVGGINTPKRAAEMLEAGASLVEVYTGFIYEGPAFVRRILKYLKRSL